MLSEVNRNKRINLEFFFGKSTVISPIKQVIFSEITEIKRRFLLWIVITTAIWSDETAVRSNPNYKELVWFITQKFAFQHEISKRVMCWSCFSQQGLSKLVVVNGTLNADPIITRNF